MIDKVTSSEARENSGKLPTTKENIHWFEAIHRTLRLRTFYNVVKCSIYKYCNLVIVSKTTSLTTTSQLDVVIRSVKKCKNKHVKHRQKCWRKIVNFFKNFLISCTLYLFLADRQFYTCWSTMSATNQQLNKYKVQHYYLNQPFIFTRFLITLLKYNNKPSTCIQFQSKKESTPIISLFRFDMRIFLQK